MKCSQHAAKRCELPVRRVQPLADRRQLFAGAVSARACDLAEPPLEAPTLCLEGERLRVAVGQGRLDLRDRGCILVEELFNLFEHHRGSPGQGVKARLSGLAAHTKWAGRPIYPANKAQLE